MQRGIQLKARKNEVKQALEMGGGRATTRLSMNFFVYGIHWAVPLHPQ